MTDETQDDIAPDTVSGDITLDDVERAVPEQILPDGIGLSLEEIRTLLTRKHETFVAKDDPILLIATMLNAYLGQVEEQNKRLHEGMIRLLTDKTDEYVKGVKDATDSLAGQLAGASVEGFAKQFHDYEVLLIKFKQSIWNATIIVAVSSVIIVAVFGALALL